MTCLITCMCALCTLHFTGKMRLERFHTRIAVYLIQMNSLIQVHIPASAVKFAEFKTQQPDMAKHNY